MKRLKLASSLLLCMAVTALAASAQVAEKANKGYQTKEDRERVGKSLGSADRVERQKPVELLASIGIHKGDVVGDIGTGVGFMLPYLVDAVGPEGKVYAEDIQKDFLSKAKKKVKEGGWKNVKFVRGKQKNVKLPANSLDLAFILDVYHHFNYPEKTLATIHKAVKPGGRLAMIDFYRGGKDANRSDEWYKNHIRLDRDGFRAEIESAGFEFERTFDHLPHQYVLIFRKK